MPAINYSDKFASLKEILRNNYTPLIFCILYTIIFSTATILRYDTFNASILDLGVEMHNLFLVTKGYSFWFRSNANIAHTNILFGYFEILYIPLGFIYKIIPHVSFFLILQSFLIGISAFPFYYITKEVIGEKWGFVGPLLLLLNPQIHTGNMYDFHISVFYVPFISFALYFALKRKIFYLYLFSFLILITKADSFLYLTSIAFFMYLTGFKNKHIIILLSIAWLYAIIVIFYIFPHFQSGLFVQSRMEVKYARFPIFTEGFNSLKSGDFLGFIGSIIQPLIENIRYNFKFLIYLVAVFGFMPLFSKKYLLIAIPPIMICWIEGFYPQHFFYSESFFLLQYSFFIIPFFVVISIYGLKNVIDFFNKTDLQFIKTNLLPAFSIFVIITTLLIQNYSSITNFPGFNIFNYKNYMYKKNFHPDSLNKEIDSIGPEYSVSASNYVGSHFYKRYVINQFPVGYKCANYIVFSTCYFIPFFKKKDAVLLDKFNNIKRSGRYNLVYKKGCNSILRLKKKYECGR